MGPNPMGVAPLRKGLKRVGNLDPETRTESCGRTEGSHPRVEEKVLEQLLPQPQKEPARPHLALGLQLPEL